MNVVNSLSFVCSFSAGVIVGLVWARHRRVQVQTKARKTEAIFFPDKSWDPIYDRENERELKTMVGNSMALRQLIRHIRDAQKTIDICLFLITSEKLTDLVLSKIPRGVRVRLIVDDSNVNISGSQVIKFRAQGAFVRSKAMPFLMHHKFCIVDGQKLLSGSFNWTMQAVTGNRENVIVIHEQQVVDEFAAEFESMWNEFSVSQ